MLHTVSPCPALAQAEERRGRPAQHRGAAMYSCEQAHRASVDQSQQLRGPHLCCALPVVSWPPCRPLVCLGHIALLLLLLGGCHMDHAAVPSGL